MRHPDSSPIFRVWLSGAVGRVRTLHTHEFTLSISPISLTQVLAFKTIVTAKPKNAVFTMTGYSAFRSGGQGSRDAAVDLEADQAILEEMTEKDESTDPPRISRRIASAKSTAQANAQAAKVIEAQLKQATQDAGKARAAADAEFADNVLLLTTKDSAHEPSDDPCYEWEFFGAEGSDEPIVQRAKRGDIVFKDGAQCSYAIFEQFLPATLGEP